MNILKNLIATAFYLLASLGTSLAQYSPVSTNSTFAKDLVNRHNYWRSEVGVSPLKWSETVAKSALSWAKALKERGCDFQHSDTDYGENLFMGTAGYYTALDAVDSWAEEKADYDVASNSCNPGAVCGHYTQMVWEKSTELGCATVECDGNLIVVCQYNPPGNYVGESPFSAGTAVTPSQPGNPNPVTPTNAYSLGPNGGADFYWNLTKNCCPDAYAILQSDAKEEFMRWVDDPRTETGLIKDFNTVVHETLHHYDFQLSQWSVAGYFLGKGIKMQVSEKSIIPSSELNDFVPKNIQDKMFHYGLYISGKEMSDMGSVKNGIYGILEEFNAYSHGLKAEVEMRQMNSPKYDIPTNIISGEMEAYFEFKLFISWYLQLLEKKYPTNFQDMMNHKNLRVTYTLIEQQFTETINKIKADPKLMNRFSKDAAAYIQSKDLAMLNRFKINGVSTQNYQSFLE